MFAGIVIACAVLFLLYMLWMPERSYRGPFLELSAEESELSKRLLAHVTALSSDIGPRCMDSYGELIRAQAYIQRTWSQQGLEVRRQDFKVDGRVVANVYTEFPGSYNSKEILVIGAHYDTAGPSCPGANDNASGVAALLELAARFKQVTPSITVRFIAFVNEEMPYFHTEAMGSFIAARRSRERGENVVGMLSLETLGYYSDAPNSQKYPAGLSLVYPDAGDFLAFVGDLRSAPLVRRAISIFRRHTTFPSEGIAAPQSIPGIGWSDHAAYWTQGFPAIMLTDTAPFRYPDYHRDSDTPDKIDAGKLARVVTGIEEIALSLSRANK